MTDKKIPLLTEVYQPKPNAELELRAKPTDSTLITPELVARIVSHIKPRLETDIAKRVTESVREALEKDLVKVIQDEILTLQASIEARTVDFVDKTKADLKTELPRMYQASANTAFDHLSENIADLQTAAISTFDTTLAELTQTAVNTANAQIGSQVEVIEADTTARIMQNINQQLSAFQAQLLDNHQTLLNEEMQQVFESVHQQGKGDLQNQLQTMQVDASDEMHSTFTAAMPAIYTAAVEEQQQAIVTQISDRLNEEMQAFHAQSISNHQMQLGNALETHLQVLNQQARQDLQQQMSLLQTDILTQISETFNAAIPSIYAAAADEVKAKFADEMTAQSVQLRDDFLVTINADLPAVQEVLRDNIQQIMAVSLPNLELDLRNQLTAELQDLLLKVKFVLPK